MKLLGVTANQVVKTTIIAIIGIILFKLAAEKSGVVGLQAIANKV